MTRPEGAKVRCFGVGQKQIFETGEKLFLHASAMLKHVIAIGWTSVHLSHAGTVSKRLNILSCFLHRTIAHSF